MKSQTPKVNKPKLRFILGALSAILKHQTTLNNLIFILFCFLLTTAQAQNLLKPDAVFDGQDRHQGWIVFVEENRITYAGPPATLTVPSTAETIKLAGMTLMPGLIEGHSHLLLHPY
ncbi:MAG: hypothetical protein ACR2MX_06930, partial [Cyclobacteriaceae bacterium]